MDIGAHGAIRSDPIGLLCRRRQPFLTQIIDRLLEIPAGLGEGLLAIHHTGSGFFPQLFYSACADFHAA